MPFMAKWDPFSPTLDHPLLNSSPDFTNPASRNGSLRARALGNGSFGNGAFNGQMSYRERSKRLRDLEDEKQQLIEELIYNLESCESQLQQMRLDSEREAQYNRDVQHRENTLQAQLRKTKEIMDRNAFILTLIDGNAMPFTTELVSQGEKGGQEAAALLSTAMDEHVSRQFSHLDKPRLVARIYADMSALNDHLSTAKIVDRPGVLAEFVRGFNSSNPHFDFVDAGNKGTAVIDKVHEVLQLNLRDCHCHQVMLGCSHDSAYSPLLEEVAESPELKSHLTLFDRGSCTNKAESLVPQFKSTRIDTVFSIWNYQTALTVPKAPPTVTAALPALAKIESNTTNGTSSPGGTPGLKWAAIAANAQAPPQSVLAKPEAAKPARTPTPSSTVSLENRTKVSSKSIDRNRMGQRVDRTDTTIPNYEIQRVKKLKLCNIYYLQSPRECTATHCSHRHDYPISNYERRVLREVARMTPCYYKFDCDDPDCIYGHRCPQSKPNEQGCYYGEDCRFYGWGHGIDMRVVKTTKV